MLNFPSVCRIVQQGGGGGIGRGVDLWVSCVVVVGLPSVKLSPIFRTWVHIRGLVNQQYMQEKDWKKKTREDFQIEAFIDISQQEDI